MNTQSDLDKQYQSLLVVWFAVLMNIGVILLVLLFALPNRVNGEPGRSSFLAGFILILTSMLLVILSFAVKRKLLHRAETNQDVRLVKQGLVIACAICEVPALMGLASHFIFGGHDYYLSFLIALIGTSLHFPRRDQLAAATYKDQSREGLS